MHIAGLLGLLIILVSLWKAQRDKNFDFNLFDLLMENGKVSRLACMALGAFATATWIVLDLQVKGKLTEGYFMAYLGSCLAPIIAKLFATGGKNDPGSD
jgi:uncharacterized membrane protein